MSLRGAANSFYVTGDRAQEAKVALADAICEARADGVTWKAIAEATEMSVAQAQRIGRLAQ